MTGFKLQPLVSEATALPTEPQPLPPFCCGWLTTTIFYYMRTNGEAQTKYLINVCRGVFKNQRRPLV